MTRTATLKLPTLKRFAKIATSMGVTITISHPDGDSLKITPEPATVQPESPLDAWRAKRAGDNERDS